MFWKREEGRKRMSELILEENNARLKLNEQ
jgi:hypothetical protein